MKIHKEKNRPINLNLWTMHFPITAIVSILHRISGIIMCFFLGILIYILYLSLSSYDGFLYITNILNYFTCKIIIWLIASIYLYHIIGGIRHILIDIGWLDDTFLSGKRTAYLLLLLSLILSIGIGIFLW
ncbi:succinate dehydrogenase, cytochrome b556 subunit [Candidatus Schneideria nysicola]|uniref:succinate dehydrogenase, cytochrome b556 subunit n=1 Tax=Candidatus Schneideria nysicola TaxID=1081631 RepID=UPI001CAA5AB6|nr:succinate dehydrogenase, cytochrome b556 subunit [Candidatus Schneideria nysicola]UAJ65624.1 succinate dehydrogenase, cytochrome b556 subunit [Candidatus Schneideria nysicola]